MNLRYLTTREAAGVLGVSERTMRAWRAEGVTGGPRVTWIRLPSGRLAPRYRTDHLEQWASQGSIR